VRLSRKGSPKRLMAISRSSPTPRSRSSSLPLDIDHCRTSPGGRARHGGRLETCGGGSRPPRGGFSGARRAEVHPSSSSPTIRDDGRRGALPVDRQLNLYGRARGSPVVTLQRRWARPSSGGRGRWSAWRSARHAGGDGGLDLEPHNRNAHAPARPLEDGDEARRHLGDRRRPCAFFTTLLPRHRPRSTGIRISSR